MMGSEQRFLGLSGAAAPFPSACVHELITAQALQSPEAVSVSCGDEALSYGELDSRSSQLAATLGEYGIGSGSVVGLLVDRSPAMVVALLAILKAGGAYVPLDPSYPSTRLDSMLALSGAALLVSEAGVISRLRLEAATRVLLLDRWKPSEPAGRQFVCASHRDTAYIIFTSGSTGQPKGVEITHSALANLLWSLKDRPGITGQDTMLAVTSISFDIAAAELLLPLLVGARIEMATYREASDPARLMTMLEALNITVLQATPVTWRLLIEAGWAGSSRLRVWCGGEEMTRSLASDLLRRSTAVWNLYGPTETTVWSTAARVTSADTSIPLGVPLANTSLYVLNEERDEVAPGMVGELYIGGAGLAKSYWRRPDLTAQSFPDVRLADGQTVRLYRTGDRVRPHADGRLEFVGRLDRQIKLRGFRIELGEIEQVASTCAGVREVAVTKTEDSERGDFLTAYVVPVLGSRFDGAGLRQELARVLPLYMVPAAVCVLTSLPVTPNGKIDRGKLPKATAEERALTASQDPPRYELELRLERLWREVLRTDAVSREDNFFSVGGDSLSAAQLVTKMARIFGRQCSVASLLQAPTIASYAAFLAGGRQLSTCIVLQQGSPEMQTRKIFWMNSPDRLYRLAGLLGDQPFYSMVLSADELSRAAPAYSMEQLAGRMVEQILLHQDDGQFYIGGFCQNALLAYEVSQQLRARGHEVPLLIMIDPEQALPRSETLPLVKAAMRRVEREYFHLSTMLKQPLADWIPYLQRRYEGILFVLEERKWQRVARTGARAQQPARELVQALFVSRLSYVPRPYHGRVLFVEPTLRLEWNERETMEDWRQLVPNGEWRYVRGDHLGLFANPGVETLSRELRQALDQATG